MFNNFDTRESLAMEMAKFDAALNDAVSDANIFKAWAAQLDASTPTPSTISKQDAKNDAA